MGEGILYSSPHNAGVTGYKRVNDWLDIEKLFLRRPRSSF
jgi:hypothetical protein